MTPNRWTLDYAQPTKPLERTELEKKLRAEKTDQIARRLLLLLLVAAMATFSVLWLCVAYYGDTK